MPKTEMLKSKATTFLPGGSRSHYQRRSTAYGTIHSHAGCPIFIRVRRVTLMSWSLRSRSHRAQRGKEIDWNQPHSPESSRSSHLWYDGHESVRPGSAVRTHFSSPEDLLGQQRSHVRTHGPLLWSFDSRLFVVPTLSSCALAALARSKAPLPSASDTAPLTPRLQPQWTAMQRSGRAPVGLSCRAARSNEADSGLLVRWYLRQRQRDRRPQPSGSDRIAPSGGVRLTSPSHRC